MAEIVLTLVVSMAVGFAIGVFSGLLGIGGGTVLVPVLKLGYALDAIAATATSLFTIIPTSVSGVIAHIRGRTCLPKLGIAAGLGGAITSPAGVWLATRSPELLIMTVAALVIGYSGYTMLRKALAFERPGSKEGQGNEGAARLSAEAASSAAEAARLSVASASAQVCGAFFIGCVAGVVSGYVGVGGGFIMVPLFMKTLGLPMKLTSGTSLIAVMILALPGVVYQGALGNVQWLIGIAVALGSVPGAFVGARLTSRVSEKKLRLMFSCFLFVAALLLVADQLSALG